MAENTIDCGKWHFRLTLSCKFWNTYRMMYVTLVHCIRKVLRALNSIYKSHFIIIIVKLFSNTSHTRCLCITLIATPFLNYKWWPYLRLMEVRGRENSGKVFLWLISGIKVSVTASYVMEMCRTDVLLSVFCDARGSMEYRCNERCLHDNAVSWYFVETSHFTLIGKAKVFKNNAWNIYSARLNLCVFFVFKTSYLLIYKMFL
jgi:hypothetical protein